MRPDLHEPLARYFADWATSVTNADVPLEVRQQAQRAILDLIGVMTCGAVHPKVAAARSAMAVASGPCTVAGGNSSDAAAAALVNGTAAHVWDFDDTSYTGIMHGSAVIFPAVLAVAEERGITDRELITAFIVGSEIAYTLADIVSHHHYFKGWWSTATLGLIGATAGAALAYGLDAASTAQAIGMAAAASGSGKCVFGTDAKAFLVGETARRAVAFCKAASAGLTGPANAFEDPRGFFALLNDGHCQRDAAETLGQRWRLLDPGLLFKLSPVCSAAHAAIEATAKLLRASGATAPQIARIRCKIPELVKMSLVFDCPESAQEAQFSLPYAVACAVLHGRVRLEDLDRVEVTSPAKHSIMAKVEYGVDVELSSDEFRARYPESARVGLTLTSGETVETLCAEAYGMPGNPLSPGHLWEKFTACAAFAGIPEHRFTPARALLETDIAARVAVKTIARQLLLLMSPTEMKL